MLQHQCVTGRYIPESSKGLKFGPLNHQKPDLGAEIWHPWRVWVYIICFSKPRISTSLQGHSSSSSKSASMSLKKWGTRQKSWRFTYLSMHKKITSHQHRTVVIRMPKVGALAHLWIAPPPRHHWDHWWSLDMLATLISSQFRLTVTVPFSDVWWLGLGLESNLLISGFGGPWSLSFERLGHWQRPISKHSQVGIYFHIFPASTWCCLTSILHSFLAFL